MVDGLIQPRQYVDVHLTPSNTSDPRLRGGTTMTLFKGVKVVAINRSISSSNVDRGGNSVTLELTPEQANIVILADTAGELTMSYNPNGKGTGGVTISDADRATLEEILSLDPLAEPTPPFQTEQFRGGSRAVNTYRDGRLIGGGDSSAGRRAGSDAEHQFSKQRNRPGHRDPEQDRKTASLGAVKRMSPFAPRKSTIRSRSERRLLDKNSFPSTRGWMIRDHSKSEHKLAQAIGTVPPNAPPDRHDFARFGGGVGGGALLCGLGLGSALARCRKGRT